MVLPGGRPTQATALWFIYGLNPYGITPPIRRIVAEGQIAASQSSKKRCGKSRKKSTTRIDAADQHGIWIKMESIAGVANSRLAMG
jgi:hypothetical protein